MEVVTMNQIFAFMAGVMVTAMAATKTGQKIANDIGDTIKNGFNDMAESIKKNTKEPEEKPETEKDAPSTEDKKNDND